MSEKIKPSKKIKPQTLKGFRDFLPAPMLVRERLMQTAREVYRSFGFTPIDTPALEYSEILLGKGGDETDKQLFRFQDQGDRDVAMRFDLTIPFARYAAAHLQELGTPFRRYHIGTVWRAEKPQKGRYREFVQCDFDTIGTKANAADIETLMVIHELLTRIGFDRFTIRVNNRMVLNGLLNRLGATDRAVAILRALDKLLKLGRDAVVAEMTQQAGVSAAQADEILRFAELKGDADSLLTEAERFVAGDAAGEEGIARLRELVSVCAAAGIPAERLAIDLSIARGLDYYTGTIYETFLGDLPGIGSVCSGGRYDNLAELFTSQPLPGVGASLGLDRLLAAMEELGFVDQIPSPAHVLIVVMSERLLTQYFRLARDLRAAGLAVEVFADNKPLGKQLQYADRKRIPWAVIAGDEEADRGRWQLKNLSSGEQRELATSELAGEILAGTRIAD